eukprot:2604510-Amphidinium_carterae.2
MQLGDSHAQAQQTKCQNLVPGQNINNSRFNCIASPRSALSSLLLTVADVGGELGRWCGVVTNRMHKSGGEYVQLGGAVCCLMLRHPNQCRASSTSVSVLSRISAAEDRWCAPDHALDEQIAGGLLTLQHMMHSVCAIQKQRFRLDPAMQRRLCGGRPGANMGASCHAAHV